MKDIQKIIVKLLLKNGPLSFQVIKASLNERKDYSNKKNFLVAIRSLIKQNIVEECNIETFRLIGDERKI